MGNPYTSQSIVGYNANPPPDDGTTGSNNEIDWSMVTDKVGDPVRALAEDIDTQLQTAFPKVIGGAGVTSTAVSYQILSSDQGKMVRATAAGITLTFPNATTVGAPFVFAILNNSSGAVTIDGNGGLIDGSAVAPTLAAGTGAIIFTDGTNWFTTGQQGVLTSKQLGYSDIINGTISVQSAANNLTVSLLTYALTTPAVSDGVIAMFRGGAFETGELHYRQVTSALTFTLASGSTMGATNGVPFRLWLVLFDNEDGTLKLGVINCLNGTNIYPLGQRKVASSTAEASGAADSAAVFYTTAAVTQKAYLILGYMDWTNGLAAAGVWNVAPDVVQQYGFGDPLPGTVIQTVSNFTGASTTGTTAVPFDDSFPQSTEGDQYMTQAITPASAANLLRIETQAILANSNATTTITGALFQDAATDCIIADALTEVNAGGMMNINLKWQQRSATTNATTFKFRAGGSTGATTTFNGSAGNRKMAGALNSYMIVDEIMA